MLAREEGCCYVHPTNEPLLVAGVGTVALEIIEDFPDVEVIFIPLGGGSGAAGTCIVARSIDPDIKIVAVQSAQAPAGYLSWKNRRIEQAPMETIAEGLATASGYELTQSILWGPAGRLPAGGRPRDTSSYRDTNREGPHAGRDRWRDSAGRRQSTTKDEIEGKKVAMIVTGGNVTLPQLREVLNVY